jgi:16S rRNA processing protein RimM
VEEYYLIAKIISLYGSCGAVKIISHSDFPERFFKLKKVYIDFFGSMKEFSVESVEQDKENFFLKFKNFDSKSDSEILIGKELFVKEADLVKIPDDMFYVHDLIGSDVFADNLFIGKLVDVLSLKANDVYVINKEDGEELLLPALKSVIKNFDAKNKILVLNQDSILFEDDED